MPVYLSPGVYVEEVPSAVQAISGAGTSTAAFVGIVPDEIVIPLAALPAANRVVASQLDLTSPSFDGKTLELEDYPIDTGHGTYTFEVQTNGGTTVAAHPVNQHASFKSQVEFDPSIDSSTDTVRASYRELSESVTDEIVGYGDGNMSSFPLRHYPVVIDTGTYTVTVTDAAGSSVNSTSVKLVNDEENAVSRVKIDPAPTRNASVTVTYVRTLSSFFEPVTSGEVKLCTSFGEFRKHFGDFSTDRAHRNLAHAVFGFFQNGGTRCYVARIKDVTGLAPVLTKFEAIDEIALVAAPGLTDTNARDQIIAHCAQTTQDRFAILDSKETISGDLTKVNIDPPSISDYAAFYFPWLQVFDPAAKTFDPQSDGRVYVPPSGHIAGIYARVDAHRGVHKAPANETVLGALDLKYRLSKAGQDGLNPHGINCIRDLNGNITVWGARTIGGDANGEWRYVNVRRLFLFLRESIDEGTQWVVFEPNTPDLWAKITRNVTAFLTTVWRDGALFGATPADAFYVKCDEETNPPETRELGQVITEIGVAVAKPAEFVIFRISQWAGPAGG